MTKQRVVFIVNPVSGNRPRVKRLLPNLIRRHLDQSKFTYEIRHTDHAGHAREIAHQLVTSKTVDAIVVAGGDGSVNEVLPELLHSNIVLGILPLGSGNGLARHLKFPMRMSRAIQRVNRYQVDTIDVGQVGDEHFVSNAGLGFDAYVAKQFERVETRGFWSYAWHTLKGAARYPGFQYKVCANENSHEGKAFLMTICNSNQYGYNVKMAPEASLQDGLLDVYIAKDFARWKAPFLVLAVLLNLHRNLKTFQHFRAKQLEIETPEKVHLHLDGDPYGKQKRLEVTLLPRALKIIT